MSERKLHRRRAIGPIEILVVLGLVGLLVGVAWSRMVRISPTPTPVETMADQLAIDLMKYHQQAIKLQATFDLTIMPESDAGPAYYAISRPMGPTLAEPVRETSFEPGLNVTANPPQIELHPDGTASSDWRVEIASADETRTVEVDGPTGVVRILPADGRP
jgi:hypothetical protein